MPFHLHGLLSLVVAVLLPRLLVLYLIYWTRGSSLWFVIHLVAAVLTWAVRAGIIRGGGIGGR